MKILTVSDDLQKGVRSFTIDGKIIISVGRTLVDKTESAIGFGKVLQIQTHITDSEAEQLRDRVMRKYR